MPQYLSQRRRLLQSVRAAGIQRESLFITSKVSPSHLDAQSLLRSCEASLRRLQMDYLDLYLIQCPAPNMRLGETFRALNKLVADGKIRHLGVSNFDLSQLQLAQSVCATPIVTNQVPYSLGDRSYVENRMLACCQANDILLTAYSPVQQSGLKVNAALQSIAESHNATVQQKRVITIPMSGNPKHQADNLAAGEIELRETEMVALG